MGLREKTEFSLQTASLVGAVAFLLFFWAARHYTSDWRERRVFKRRLVDTHRRLTTGKDERVGGRLQWKRFVAAVPLVPLATAYVAVRLGWDVFELLVFCSIDFSRHASVRTVEALVAGSAWVHASAAEVARRLDAGRRLQAAVIAVVEGAVVWLFHSLFPAVARAAGWARGRGEALVRWWERVDGAVWLRDAVEAAVLEGIVPAVDALWRGGAAVAGRSAWLVGRAVEAAAILGADVARDLRLLAACAAVAADWLACDRRWWRDPLIRVAAVWVATMGADCLRLLHRWLATWVAPRLADALCLLWAAGKSAVCACGRLVDTLLQSALGAAVRLGGLLAPLATRARVWLQRVDFLRGLARGLRALGHCAGTVVGWAVRALALAAALGADAHAWAVSWVLLPGARLVAAASVLASVNARKGAVWVARVIGGPLVLAACDVARAVEAAGAKAVAWIMELEWNVDVLAWLPDVEPWVGRMWALLAGLGGWWDAWPSVDLWPAVVGAWREAAQAMADVYSRLVAAADAGVALVGDLIVEIARQNTVHGEQPSYKPV
ncbi:hypothetical protein IWW39_001781 [Coemansia spiralis]|uniref:Uncharacterized protein n=1 Tax=Coemansia spiralis TaxID=417178 RepID=A0A9W8GM80_9FUNG|nr:hypothetical protein IWW39_001781 [Coemansia spiralis]